MKSKILSTLPLLILLTACDSNLKEKPFSEYTEKDKNNLCQLEEIQTKLGDKYIMDQEFYNNPKLFNEQKFNELKKWIKFSWSDTNFDPSNDQKTKISCSTKLTMIPDYKYGRQFNFEKIPFYVERDPNTNEFIVELPISTYKLKSEGVDIEPTKGQIEYKNKVEQEKQERVTRLSNIPLEEYKPITNNELVYIYFAQTPENITDEDILSVFVSNWRNITNSFEKKEIIEQKLPVIKEKIAKYKDIKNILFYNTSEKTPEQNLQHTYSIESSLNNAEYDFNSQTFKLRDIACPPEFNDGYILGIAGIDLHIKKSIRQCSLPIKEDMAKTLSEKLAFIKQNYSFSLFIESKLYLHIDEINQNNDIKVTIVKEYIKIVDKKSGEVLVDQFTN